jgi:hypothetical protein
MSESNPSTRALAALGFSAAAALAAIIAVTVATGVSQETFESVHSPAEYAALLRAGAGPLRLILAFDAAFIVFYTGFFAVLASLLRPTADRLLLRLAIGAMLLVAALDMIEDHHILAMLAAATGPTGSDMPSASELVAQAAASSVKFHLSYLSVFLFGLLLPRRNTRERLVAGSMLAVQLPIGIALFVAPAPADTILGFLRWGFYLSGFALLSLTFDRSRSASATGALGAGAVRRVG